MVPPKDFLGLLPVWAGVYLLAALAFALSGYVFYRRVFGLIALGKPDMRWDRPWTRLAGAVKIVLGQRKVIQSFSLRDRAGLGHALIFWGFLSFFTSYALFIFADSLVPDLSVLLLGEGFVRAFTIYIDVAGVAVLASLVWAVFRRWLAKPHRLTFDLTRSMDAVIIVALIASLMVLTFLAEGFYIAATAAPVGQLLAGWFAGVGAPAATALHALSWWLHLGVILGFAVYIPFSKHMHMVASPLNAFFRDLHPRGALRPIPNIEQQEHFGAGKVQDVTWKELLDGYACAVCGRCTNSCPANLTGKVLSPMHIVEDAKAYLIETGAALRAAHRRGHPGARGLGLRDLRRLRVGVPRGGGAHRQHHRHAAAPGPGAVEDAGDGQAGAPEHGAARTPLARDDLQPHRLDEGPGPQDPGRGP